MFQKLLRNIRNTGRPLMGISARRYLHMALSAATGILAVLAIAVLLTACDDGAKKKAEDDSNSTSSGSAGSSTSPAYTTHQSASTVIGYPNFTLTTAPPVTPNAHELNLPFGRPFLNGSTLYVPDFNYNRILGFNNFPVANGASANFVIGQTGFGAQVASATANNLAQPVHIQAAGGQFFVADSLNSRVLIYNTIPTATNPAANIVVGQTTLTGSTGGCSATAMRFAPSVFVAGGKLIVSDTVNSRVLWWNTIPAANGAAANHVLGQSTPAGGAIHCTDNDANNDGTPDASPTSQTLSQPQDVWSDGTKLVVADFGNSRVLIWNTFPTVDRQAADLVLGQSDFAHNSSNDDDQDGADDGFASGRTLAFPISVTSDGTRLFVSDSQNNRVLVWNSFPTANFQPADVVLGQRDFFNTAANDNTGTLVSGTGLNLPVGISVSGNNLFVTDGNNNRVLVFIAQ